MSQGSADLKLLPRWLVRRRWLARRLTGSTRARDVVVTRDYGLAAMHLAKVARAVDRNGLLYASQNIEKLLWERHVSQKIRRGGGRTPAPPKRRREDDERFERALK